MLSSGSPAILAAAVCRASCKVQFVPSLALALFSTAPHRRVGQRPRLPVQDPPDRLLPLRKPVLVEVDGQVAESLR